MKYLKRLFSCCLQVFRRHRHLDVESAVTDNVNSIFTRRFTATSLSVVTESQHDMSAFVAQLRLGHCLPTAVGCHSQFSRNESVNKTAMPQRDALSVNLFCRAIEPLPEVQRRVLLLRKVYAVSQADIARQLDIDETTVEQYVSVGLCQCVQYLRKRHENSYATQVITGAFANKRN